jgi:hypothetical protein
MTACPILVAAFSTGFLGALIATSAMDGKAVRQMPPETAPTRVGPELGSLDSATE